MNFVKVTIWRQVLFTSRGNLDLTSVSNNETQSLQIFEIENVLIITYMTCVIPPTTTYIPIISKLFIMKIMIIVTITFIILI